MIQRQIDQYLHLKITEQELEIRIQNSDSSALKFNAYQEGSIVGIPVGVDFSGRTIYHQFERTRMGFRDLNLCN